MNALLRLAAGGLAADRVRRLLDRHGGPEAVVDAVLRGRVEVPVSVRVAMESAGDVLPVLQATGTRFVAQGDPGFPARFDDLAIPPPYLFVRGSIPAVPMIGIVGTRQCSGYGRRVASAYAEALVRTGVPVVSGLARGIDGAAHRGAVRGGGPTVAVLGSGIDVWYPAEHAALGTEILATGGGVVSEFPPSARPLPWRFPIRNRLIAALSTALVVVEAGESGGALITARQALDLGREVFATPGDVDRPSSVGCNRLIRDGALPVLHPGDLLDAVDLLLGRAGVAGEAAERADQWLWDAIGPYGQRYELLVRTTGRPVSDILATMARLEAAGAVTITGDSVHRNPDSWP